MGGKGCNLLIRTEKTLTWVAYVGASTFMQLLREFQYPKSSLLNLLNVMIDCDFLIKSERNQYSPGIKSNRPG